MRLQHYKSISLCLVVLLCFFYSNKAISISAPKSIVDEGVKYYSGYYMLHFSDYYDPLDNTESVNDVVSIKFAQFSVDSKYIWYIAYRKGKYSNLERMYADLLKVPVDREKRSRQQHEMMFMQLAAYWGNVQEHSMPIGSCKIMYSGDIIYPSIAAITFYDKTGTKPKVCVCFVGDCNVKPVKGECDQRSIRCKEILQAIDPPPFCSIFDRTNIVSIVPLSFSKQNFFKSGAKLRIHSGSTKPYEMDLYANSYKLGEKTSYNVTYLGTPYEFKVYKAGYDKTCVEYTDNGMPGKTTCVPSPGLVRPKITSHYGNNVRIEYKDCKQPSICTVDIPVGAKDENLLFSVIKPKINLKDYTLINQYECSDGQIVEDSSKCAGGASRLGYAHNSSGNVVCVVDMPFVSMKYSLRKDHRNFWLSAHKKMLWGYGVVAEKTQDGNNSERYVRCNYESAVDITMMTQDQLDTMRSIRNNLFFNIAGHYDPKIEACQGSALYKYEDGRLYKKDRKHSCKDVVKWNNGVNNFESCTSFYLSDDDFDIFFHDNNDKDNIEPLNPILQGMCISNFPSREYRVRTLKRKVLPNSYDLHIDENKTACDFLKIEAWGGGASGISKSGKSGKSGSYIMGLLRLDKDVMSKKLIVSVGSGGKGRNNYLSHSGEDTSVKLCDENGKNCTIELIAQGGHDMGSYLNDLSKGIEHLAHYRFVPGLNQSKRNEILVPYQGIDLPYGSIPKREQECVCDSNQLEKNSNKYLGAGGCSSIYNCAQEGADGMVRLTCEKWSDSVGQIALTDENACDDSLVEVIEGINRSTDYLPDKVKEFLLKISKPKFCNKLTFFPRLVVSISEYLSTLKKVLHDRALSLHDISMHRKKLLAELNNVQIKKELKSLGINDSSETLLLYIDALAFNLCVNILSPPGGLLNYYVLDNGSENIDQLASNMDYTELSNSVGSIFNVYGEEFDKRDFFSVELEDHRFLEKYEDFINMIHRGVITEQFGYRKNNIVVSWMYVFFKDSDQIFQLYAASFVKLMLGIDLMRYMKTKSCSQEMTLSLKKISQYKYKLPLALQDFIDKINEEKFCKELSMFPELATSLDGYMTALYDVISYKFEGNSVSDSEILWFNLKARVSNFKMIVERENISQVFTDLGISSDNIMLLFDAVTLNWVVSEVNITQDLVTKLINELFSFDSFPSDDVMMLFEDVKALKYGKHSLHKFNIIISWLYVYYLSYECYECFKDFVALILETNIGKTSELHSCNDMDDFLRSINKYKEKLSVEVQQFIMKINEPHFCEIIEQFPDVVDILNRYKVAIYNLADAVSRNQKNVSSILMRDQVMLQLNTIFYRPEIYNIFSVVDIMGTRGEVELLFNVAVFNWVVSELNLSPDAIKLSFVDMNIVNFPHDDIAILEKDIKDMKYGELGSHKLSVVLLWLYSSYMHFTLTDNDVKSFIRLIFGSE